MSQLESRRVLLRNTGLLAGSAALAPLANACAWVDSGISSEMERGRWSDAHLQWGKVAQSPTLVDLGKNRLDPTLRVMKESLLFGHTDAFLKQHGVQIHVSPAISHEEVAQIAPHSQNPGEWAIVVSQAAVQRSLTPETLALEIAYQAELLKNLVGLRANLIQRRFSPQEQYAFLDAERTIQKTDVTIVSRARGKIAEIATTLSKILGRPVGANPNDVYQKAQMQFAACGENAATLCWRDFVKKTFIDRMLNPQQKTV